MALPAKTMHGLELIIEERAKQERMKAEGRFKYTCADPEMNNYERFTVLGEEFGEVAIECLTQDGTRQLRGAEGTPEALRKELAQVAAVSLAWIEALL